MRIDVVTIFPDYLDPLRLSLIGRARGSGLIDVHTHDLRDFTQDRHRTVDDTPYGGGAGMVMRPEPWGEALDHVLAQGTLNEPDASGAGPDRPHLIVPTPAGIPFTQALAAGLAVEDWLIFACGRYEGIDERVLDYAATRMLLTPVSLGDYVLGGGEVAALAIIEAVVRLLPGVLGNPTSLIEESHANGLLEYPVYTKPASWRGLDVPEVLRSGNHEKIATWRLARQLDRTMARRPDLVVPTTHGSGLEGLDIAPARPADVGELFTLQRACWLAEAQDNPGVVIPALTESIREAQQALQQWRTVVARMNGRLVASVRARADDQQWHIGRIMVAPDLQGRGWGRALLDLAESCAPPQAREYWLFTGARSRGNQRLYRKAGYRVRPDVTPPPGAVVMTKRRTTDSR